MELGTYSQTPHIVVECSIAVDEFTVVGDLVLPDERRGHPVIVFVWGSGPAGRESVSRPSQLLTCFLNSGFGVFIEDKPGCGSSTGSFDEGRLLRQRARILSAEASYFRGLADVEPVAVGAYGGSQASYVLAMALDSGTPLDFVIAVSCPTTDSVEQSAYLVEQQLLCAGHPLATAAKARQLYMQRARATDYDEYLDAAVFLDGNEVVRDELNWGGVVSREDFAPHDATWGEFYDPAPTFGRITVPLLALFGERDTQVDPQHGVSTFARSVSVTTDSFSRVLLLAGADHNMRVSKTGCLREQKESYARPGGGEYVPLFLETLAAWLVELRGRLCSGC